MDAPVNALLEALSLARAGRTEAAARIHRAILARDPGQPDANLHLGLLLLAGGRAGAAVPLLAAAAGARPGDVRARLRLAEACLAAGDPSRALETADGAPDGPEALFLRGTALNALGRPAEAEAALRRAAASRPRHAETHANLGNALADLDRLPEALTRLERATELAPDLAEAWTSLGCALIAAGRLADAVAACERAVALRPDLARAHWNIGIASLLAGDWARGWEKYEWRFRNDPLRRGIPSLPGPVWDGADPAGRSILVFAEQGFGDAIQFARYLPLLAARGAKVAVACAPPLVPLLEGLAHAVPKGGPLPRYELWIDQMSLPRLFGTAPGSVPFADGYLAPRWRPSPRRDGPPRVGIVWAGNPAHSNDRRRSLPRACLAALTSAPVEWVSLQAGPRAPEAADLRVPDRSAELSDYAATARIVRSLDLVVSIDSSVVHLAGALGCPVWTMLPHAPDWRWMLGRETTPWYSSMRLIRQGAPAEWDGVVAQIVAGCARLTASGDAPPASVG